MFEIELHTFLIVVELLMVIYAVTAFVVYFVRRHIMHLTMGISFVFSFAAFFLMHGHIDNPEPWVVVIYNFLLLLSVVLIIGGFRGYYKLKVMPLRYLISLFFSMLGTYYFTDINPNYVARVSVNSLFLVLFLVDTIYEARHAIKTETTIIKRIIFGTLGSLTLFFILRFLYVVFFAPLYPTLIEAMWTTALTTGFFSVITYNFWIIGSMLLESNQTFRNLSAENEKMESLAMLDPLLKIYNRNKLEEDMMTIVEKSNRLGDIASLLLIDLDRFKSINDQFGHDVGDAVLIQASKTITSLLRSEDRVYRWGGDEFLIMAPLTDINGAVVLGQRINDQFESSTFPKINKLSVSIGCAQHFQFETHTDWFKRVDLTLYKAKQAGRNRIEYWNNLDVLPASFAKLIWRDAFQSGHDELDRQHKDLVRLSNELYDRLGSADSMMSVDEILDQVGAELQAHFDYEYNLIKSLNYKQTMEHGKIHDRLLYDYAQLRVQLKEGTVNLGAFFNFVSVRIVAEHIIKEDSKFFELVKSSQS